MRTEILEGLQRALDHHYRRLAAAARREWRERFGKEPSDRSVSIRINAPAKKARLIPTAGFLSARTKLARAKRKFHFPGFAH